MKKLAIIILITLAFIMLTLTILVQAARSESLDAPEQNTEYILILLPDHDEKAFVAALFQSRCMLDACNDDPEPTPAPCDAWPGNPSLCP